MGKIRIKVLGDEEQEQEKQKEAKIKKEQKEARKAAETPVAEKEAVKVEKPKKPKTMAKKRTRSKSYQTVVKLVDKQKTYSINEALKLLEQLKRAKFDETVELHINTTEPSISGSMTLPHGTGKQTRVVIADDKIIADVEKGKIDFDILLAAPQMMSKLAKVAKILGPRGLMPNPKNGTITSNPEEAIKKFSGGLINYKTETKTPIIHMRVGKLSFGEKKLAENIAVVFANINATKIKNATLKSTMSPGIKIQI